MFSYTENLCDVCQQSINAIDKFAGDFRIIERLSVPSGRGGGFPCGEGQ
jgi:hypothetical protein